MFYETLPFFFVLLKIVFSVENPIVELPNGNILGRQAITFVNNTYYAFQKIPYAAPPVGSLRFKEPQPPENWDDNLDTTTMDVSCFQIPSPLPTDSEDCLYINVFTPQLPDDDNNVSLPVLLFIHGGSFVEGSSIIGAPDLFIDNGVIVVSINYRLGIFGFLSTEDDVIPGNNGLKDQKLAIQWTYTNIHLFGGDSNKITISGESAGAAAVGYLLLDQDLEELIKGAILESGTSLCTWALQRNARNIAFDVGTMLNSTFENSTDSASLLQFLQNIEAEDLNTAAIQYTVDNTPFWAYDAAQGIIWAPVIEVRNPNAFLTRKMYGLFEAGNALRVPTLLGFNSEESLFFNADSATLQLILNIIDEYLVLLIPDGMQITGSDRREEVALSIRNFYTDGKPFGSQFAALLRYATDNSYVRPMTKHAELFSPFADTFFYQFSYMSELGDGLTQYEGAQGVGHTEELYYLYCLAQGCDFSSLSESDGMTSKRLVKLWSDFVKYQNPTPEPSELLQNITWPKLSVQDGDFLYLDINKDLEVRNHPKQDTIQKWSDLYSALEYQDFDTY